MMSFAQRITLAISFIVFVSSADGDATEKSAQLQEQLPDSQDRFRLTKDYVHDWVKFPDISGRDVVTKRDSSIRTRYGRSMVVVFVSSWCIPCQRLAPRLKALQDKHESIFTDIIFIYTGDTEKDARGFASEYQIKGPNILATPAIIQEFRNPEPPSIFVADRHGWLIDIISKPDTDRVEELDEFLTKMALK